MELLENISNYENIDLWKYLDFHRFASLAFTKKLVFTRLDKLNDPIEGMKRDYLMNCLSAEHTPDNPDKINPNIPDKQRNQIVADKKYFESIKQDEKEKAQRSQFANCWFLGNRESMAMWNLYSTESGIVIKVNAKHLINFVAKSINVYEECFKNHKTYCGAIIYVKLNPFDPFDLTPIKKISGFKKDSSYNYENEFRFLIAVSDSQIGKIEIIKLDLIEIEKFNFDIIAHPNIKDWQFENIITISKSAFPNANVLKSKITLKKQ